MRNLPAGTTRRLFIEGFSVLELRQNIGIIAMVRNSADVREGSGFVQDREMKAMLIEYMGKGFLENIIALFKQDKSLYPFIADMLSDENFRVRLGAVALVEELARGQDNELRAAVPGLIRLLVHESPTIRGDAASVLGTIKDRSARVALEACLRDGHPGVREAARDALDEIGL